MNHCELNSKPMFKRVNAKIESVRIELKGDIDALDAKIESVRELNSKRRHIDHPKSASEAN